MLGDPATWYHGYGISRRLGIAVGSLYPALARLSEGGLLEARWDLPTEGGQPRHLYRLTAQGTAFARSLASVSGQVVDAATVAHSQGPAMRPTGNPA
jgi:DNA-binding PadR family transcriptional regulator